MVLTSTLTDLQYLQRSALSAEQITGQQLREQQWTSHTNGTKMVSYIRTQ